MRRSHCNNNINDIQILQMLLLESAQELFFSPKNYMIKIVDQSGQ